jgi:PIN domain nuclease of toxin-antitoxin system
MTTLLDASALLAAINDEAGSERVAECLGDSAISAVNLAEVAAKLADFGWSDAEIEDTVAGLQIDILPFEAVDALASANLRRELKRLGLSLGDRACLVTALRTGHTVLTADKAWGRVKLAGVRIELAR